MMYLKITLLILFFHLGKLSFGQAENSEKAFKFAAVNISGQYTYAGFGQATAAGIAFQNWQLNVGGVWLMNYSHFSAPALGPHLSLQYAFLKEKKWSVWTGLLIQYVFFQIPDTEISSSLSGFLQYGLDYQLTPHFALTGSMGLGLFQEKFQFKQNQAKFETGGMTPFIQLGIKKLF